MPTTPNFSQPAIFSEVATPTVPDSGYLKVYAKSGALYSIDSAGTEKNYGAAGGGGGITSINGNSTATQLLTVGTAGTNFAIDSTTTPGTSVFNIPDAGESARGLITTGTQTIAGTKTLVGDLLFTDATYDIGKGGATRPRDGFFSRNLTVGAQATVPYGDSTNPSILIGSTDTGIHGLNGASKRIRFTIGGTLTAEYAAGAYVVGGTLQFGTIGSSANTGLVSPSSAVLEIRQIHANTTAQTLRLNNTYTSATSFENLQFKAVAGAAYQIGSAIGSAGGTNRDLNFGIWDTAGTFASSFYVGSTYAGVNDSKIFYVGTSSRIEFSALSSLASPAIRFAWGGGSPACVYGGSNTLGVGINGFTRLLFGTSSTDFTGSPFTISNTAVATGAYTGFTFTGAAHTNQTASTEATMVNWNLAQTVQFATGALTTQRAMRIQAPTYSFVGASTITTASTLSISGAPVAGTNATITRSFALVAEAGDIAVANTAKLCLDTSGYAWIQGTSASGGGYVVDFYNRYSSNPQIKLSSSALILQAATGGLVFTTSASVATIDAGIARNAAATIEINTGTVGTYGDLICRKVTTRNTTTATSIEVTGTYTSSTSYERLNMRGVASANFEIGPENGSAGGTPRGLTLGGYTAGSATITPWLSFTSSGTPTFDQGTVVIPSGGTGLVCQQNNIYLDSYGTHSGIRYRRSEGTQGSPTGVALNSLVGFVATYGYHTGSAYHTTKGASIDFYATEAYTSGAQGTKIVFGTTPNGTTTNTVALTIDQNQVATFSKLVAQSAAEITSTPSGTTQTITLNNGNHQTLTLTSSTGAVTATLTVPSNVSSGTIIVKQHGTTPRNITWAVSAGTIKWMGTQPTWSSDAVNDIRIVSWRYDGSVMYLMSTDKAA